MKLIMRQSFKKTSLTVTKLALTATLAALLCHAAPGARAQQTPAAKEANKFYVAGFDRDEDAINFFRKLQAAVAANDRARVASMIDYPVNVSIGSRRVRLRRKADLLRRYEAVFNRNVKDALAQQQASELSPSWRGVMIGNGQIWFAPLGDGKSVKIVAINN
jgi:hypothetical protein